jgi:CBS domain-containing protein
MNIRVHPEAIAGIPHKPGRALYGLRRQATDLAPEFAQDAQVLDRTGKVIGMVSESDVLRHALAAAPGHAAPGAHPCASAWAAEGGGTATLASTAALLASCDLGGVRVGEVMGPVGATFAPGDELQALSRFFAADGVQRVAVIENDILLGIVTPADVLRRVVSPR